LADNKQRGAARAATNRRRQSGWSLRQGLQGSQSSRSANWQQRRVRRAPLHLPGSGESDRHRMRVL